MTHLAYASAQDGYRFYADGTESGSVALAAEDTNIIVDVDGGDVLVLLRMGMQEAGGATGGGSTFQLQSNINGGGLANVTGATSSIQASAGAVTDDEVTTQRLTGFSGSERLGGLLGSMASASRPTRCCQRLNSEAAA